MQTKIPCVLMRGGTSKGPYFLASDLPADPTLRDQVLLAVMGSPDIRQIDGVGGADPLTSKVAIVSAPSTRPDCDVDYLFAQVVVSEAVVDISPNCGNMLAAVVPFALERGLVKPQGEETTLRILTVNTDMLCDVILQTPGGRIRYDGDARIDGVPGTSAPIKINFLDTAGSVCKSLLPTGKVLDVVQGVQVTCIDNGMPVVLMRAADLGRTGYETRDQLNADAELKARLEAIRLELGPLMNLGDVTKKVVPKMCLIAPPQSGSGVCTRTFIPHDCHSAVGVLGAVTVATACVLEGSVTQGLAVMPGGLTQTVSVEHPTGEFSVELGLDPANPQNVTRAALLRTARLLMRGDVMVPAATLTR